MHRILNLEPLITYRKEFKQSSVSSVIIEHLEFHSDTSVATTEKNLVWNWASLSETRVATKVTNISTVKVLY